LGRSRPLKFAVGLPAVMNYPPVMSAWEAKATGLDVVRIARAADRAGWHWVTVPEHAVMPREMVDVMGARFPESLAAAAFLAGATERLSVLTYVLVLPYRNPVLLAKQVATVDFLSGGRLILGVGAGHLQREFEVLQAPFEGRGRLMDEYLLAMKELWTSPEPTFHGRAVRFDGIAFEPKPVQKPHPPILIGGNSPLAMRRAARLGDGWAPWLVPREKLPACLEYLRAQPGFEGREDRFEVVMPLARFEIEDFSHRPLGETALPADGDQILEEVEKLRAAGATVVQVVPPRTPNVERAVEWVQWFGEEIIPTASR